MTELNARFFDTVPITKAYREMVARSLLSRGSSKRLKTAIEKAKRGESVTLAYIGGSITHGAGADPLPSACYAYRSYADFKACFGRSGGDSIHLVKAGLGGTPSELGMIRYERDVLRDGTVQPDIVIIEFAVNDADDETEGVCYESLVLKALSAPNKPAVILLFSVFENDWNLQDRLSPVGSHYGLPMVSIKDAVTEQFRKSPADGGLISKEQFFADIYHPTNTGHAIMADCLGWLFEETNRSPADQEDIALDLPPLIGNDFTGVRLLDRASSTDIAAIAEGSFMSTDTELQLAEMDDHSYGTPQFPHNWMHTGDSASQSFKMTIRCRSLLLVYKNSGSDMFGSAELWVNGKHVGTANSHAVRWTRCHAVILHRSEQSNEHMVEIFMAAGHENKRFTILGFGYVL
ncbi:SGNH/GDSL hydrolase family protein [Paenibacillus sambharensis]|nr:SGNH/GDSL hydrolase family protein [Paenibacillus sambharensis]